MVLGEWLQVKKPMEGGRKRAPASQAICGQSLASGPLLYTANRIKTNSAGRVMGSEMPAIGQCAVLPEPQLAATWAGDSTG